MNTRAHRSDPLVRFLYVLLRDHLPSGTVEEIMTRHVESKAVAEPITEVVFSNEFTAGHAIDLAARLRA